MKAIIISVGDELLNGQTVDTNAAWIAVELNNMGVEVALSYTCSDQYQAIIDALEYATSRADIVLMTGGLGPTKDDITKKSIADFVGDSMVFNEKTEQIIKTLSEHYKFKYTQEHHDQCYMPSSAKLLKNSMGTAPGMWIERENFTILSMPGVPYEMKAIMKNGALAKINTKNAGSHIEHFIIQTAGIGETNLSEMIQDLVDDFPSNLSMAYLPGTASVKLRITGRGIDKDALIAEVNQQGQKISDRVKEYRFAHGEVSLSKALGELCISKNIKIATAESCTGGHVAHLITSVAGASAYFEGAIISYSNAIKENLLHVSHQTLQDHGAVSEATVVEMVQGTLTALNVDVAVAISGIAGPSGGTSEKPVGTVWIAVGTKDNIKTKKLQLSKNRMINIQYSTTVALNELRRFIAKYI